MKLYTCQEISKLTCFKDELNSFEKLNYNLHLFICSKCRNYSKSIEEVSVKFKTIVKDRKACEEDIVTLEKRAFDSLKKKSDS
ncbi:hypothetical protein BIY24_09480 [Halobacteriovorax marinus]|uniref:hypothetical protein n=1 Tax=Halobacteriovorax marinus TaxID=97084 RepID=UPI000BC2FCC9|nr:hypothetical protein [Halobacteriovorax marinus]ATH08170.1 hypothetical protein BIY24_09480 [Halobacteriovorax marinus]